MISAALPMRSEPQTSSRPKALAPLIVAICKATVAETAVASPETALPNKAAVRISPNISKSLLLAAPSVPRATLIPAAMHLATGLKPLANFRLDSGQCTICAPALASCSISASLNWVMCTAINEELTKPMSCRRCKGVMPL